MHCQQGGGGWAWNGLLHAFRRFPSGFELFFLALAVSQGASAWAVIITCLTGVVPRCWAILPTSLTGEGGQSDRRELSWCSYSVSWGGSHAFVQGELHWFRGACMCAGEALCGFRALVSAWCSLLEHVFVSDVSSRCPCLRGPRLVFFRWSFSLPSFGFPSLVGVSFYSFLFFFFSLWLLFVGVVNALIKGEIEDHVWYED
jgi:hypothetical protein